MKLKNSKIFEINCIILKKYFHDINLKIKILYRTLQSMCKD